MNKALLVSVFAVFLSSGCATRSAGPGPQRPAAHFNPAVPQRVADLVRPLLDLQHEALKECGLTRSRCLEGPPYEHQLLRSRRFAELLVRLVQDGSSEADEGLVVLTSFYVGESQEDVDAILERGARMLPYLEKYHANPPTIPNRQYPPEMLRSDRTEHIDRLIEAIQRPPESER